VSDPLFSIYSTEAGAGVPPAGDAIALHPLARITMHIRLIIKNRRMIVIINDFSQLVGGYLKKTEIPGINSPVLRSSDPVFISSF
jgi:hypothetical protein